MVKDCDQVQFSHSKQQHIGTRGTMHSFIIGYLGKVNRKCIRLQLLTVTRDLTVHAASFSKDRRVRIYKVRHSSGPIRSISQNI